jgi:ABC-type branched-subunit amino acid transport system substrate-binding protein
MYSPLFYGGLLTTALLFLNACGVRQVQKPPVPTQPTTETGTLPNPNNTQPSSKLPTTTAPATDVVVRPPISTPPIATPPKKEIKPIDTATPAAFDRTKQQDIALFLPFMSQYYREGINMDSISEKSKIALEYYQGVALAQEHLQQQGVQLNINVFDTENNAAKVSRLLADSTTMRDIDLIIGPIHNGELKETAQYAKRHQIYNIAPLSPATQNTKDNPYYIIANPPIETHIRQMYQYISKNYANRRIITISGNKTDEADLSNLLSSLSAQNRENHLSTVHPLTYDVGITSVSDIETQMSNSETNVFVVTTFVDEALIIDLSNKLNSLRSQYDITLFGMPNWIELPNLPLDVLANLNFYYTTPYFDTQTSQSEAFKQAFYGKYHCYPTEYAAKAYDLTRYFGEMQQQYGKQSGAKLQDKQGLYTNFKFRPSTNPLSKAKTDYIENDYINIIRFRNDYVLEKVN